MIILNEETVRANARQAYLENRLQAQHSTNPNDQCRYRGPAGTRCAIGASLSDYAARKFDKINSGKSEAIGDLIEEGYVESDNEYFLRQLQHAHDSMLQVTNPSDREYHHKELRKLLKLDQPDAA